MLQLLSWTVLKDVLAANGWAVQLKALSCPGCGFSGPLGALAPYFPSLAVLDLSVNQLSGVIPPDLASYSGLKYISLARNRLYGERQCGICKCTQARARAHAAHSTHACNASVLAAVTCSKQDLLHLLHPPCKSRLSALRYWCRHAAARAGRRVWPWLRVWA